MLFSDITPEVFAKVLFYKGKGTMLVIKKKKRGKK